MRPMGGVRWVAGVLVLAFIVFAVSCEGCARCAPFEAVDAAGGVAALATPTAPVQPRQETPDAGTAGVHSPDWLNARIKAALNSPRARSRSQGSASHGRVSRPRLAETGPEPRPGRADKEESASTTRPDNGPSAAAKAPRAVAAPRAPSHNTQLEHRLGIELAGIAQQLQQVELLHRKLEGRAQQGDLGDKQRQELTALSQDLRTLRRAQGALQAQLQRLRVGR